MGRWVNAFCFTTVSKHPSFPCLLTLHSKKSLGTKAIVPDIIIKLRKLCSRPYSTVPGRYNPWETSDSLGVLEPTALSPSAEWNPQK